MDILSHFFAFWASMMLVFGGYISQDFGTMSAALPISTSLELIVGLKRLNR